MKEYVRRERNDIPVEVEDDEIDLLQLVGTLWRGKWIIFLCAAVATFIGGFYAYEVAVPKYSATTTIAIDISDTQVVDIESVVSGVSSDAASLNTEIEVIRSRKLAEQLVEDFKLVENPHINPLFNGFAQPRYQAYLEDWFDYEFPAPSKPTDKQLFDATVAGIMGAVSASLQRNTYIFAVTATTTDPQASVLVANALSQIYIEDQIAVKFEATEKAVTWLSDRVAELEEELKSREDAIKDLRAGSNVVTPESLTVLNRQASDMRERLDALRVTAEGAELRLSELKALQDAEDPQEMRNAFSDPVLQRLYNDIPSGGTQALDLFYNRFELLVQREAMDAERAVVQAASLEVSYDQLQDRVNTQTQQLIELQQLERETEATRVLYDTFLTRLKETSVQVGLQEADARILSPAINGRYVEPRKGRIVALSFILGSMIGIGIVLVLQFLHRGYRTADELEKHTGIVVMGQIPRIPISRRDQLIEYLRSKPTSAAVEAIRNLRTSVLLSNIDTPPCVIMSTSSIPGEGKTTQAIALAQNFVGLGKSVLLIEGDVRRRAFGQYFTNTPTGGVIAALTGDQPLNEVVFHDEALGADVLMGEKSSVNAADLFSSDRFHEFMLNAREAYDIVIIDTPPVLVVPDARVIGQSVDAIVYSVKWDKTAKAQVEEGMRQFATANLRITGFALSQIDPKGMHRYGYGGRYSAYGAYAKYGKHYYDT